MFLLPFALAQENGVLLCEDYRPSLPEVAIEPTCASVADAAVHRVNACFTTCTADQQEFRFTVLNRGGEAAEEVVLRVMRGGAEVWSETIGTLDSGEVVQVGPIAFTPTSFDRELVAVVESRQDCTDLDNEAPLWTALFGGEWPEPTWDADRDGFTALACGGDDCDDDDPRVHPGAPEDLGEDNDCDGLVAEDIRRCATSPAWGGLGLVLLAVGVRVRRPWGRAGGSR
ncbi:MAG: hypothetical protein H6737_03080 [Alphaproteobacteria bacterium]|nr:hypothetical protein [Alphaproteobacteria bacterium]